MANDPKQYQEEEYLFSEDEQPDVLTSTEPSSTPMSDDSLSRKESFLKMWRKNLVIGIGLIFVVFIVYKVISAFFSSDVPAKQIPAIPTTPAAQSQITSTSLSQNIAASQPTNVPASSLHADVSSYNQNRGSVERLAKLEQNSQNLSAEIEDLQTTAQSLQSSVDNINAQLVQINTTLSNLNHQMQVNENRLAQAHKKAAVKVIPKPVVRRDTYRVLALIPGRAWLKSSRGATITVSEGSLIPGYGKVITINTQLGTVVMSSGETIEYAPNDQ